MSVPTVRLSRSTLKVVPSAVSRPAYTVSDLSPGIVHIGVGNFHRAHMAWYLHRLMQQGEALDWAIVGAGVHPNDRIMRERLLAQDCLTTLLELHPDGAAAEICGSMIDFLPVQDDNRVLVAEMAKPSTRIVSLTVTEGGYFLDQSTGAFNASHPDIIHDITHPTTPKTAFGAIVAALSQRCANGHGPFTVQSCDNLRGNGAVTREAVLSLAQHMDPGLAAWISAHCTFPNSMVDCIVPATGDAERAMAADLGILDAAPVPHERYRQWVIEDAFCAGRPPWDLVGATFTEDVHAYETMKIRVLNAGHQVLANVGELLGTETIAGCLQDQRIAAFFRKVQREEIVPLVEPVPEITPQAYADLIERRFANPAIRDTTRRVAFDGSSRHPAFILPIVRDALAQGRSVTGLALVEALWARMCAGMREDGAEIPPNDPNWEALIHKARESASQPAVWLQQQAIYADLVGDPQFAHLFERWLYLIWTKGTVAALQAYCAAPENR